MRPQTDAQEKAEQVVLLVFAAVVVAVLFGGICAGAWVRQAVILAQNKAKADIAASQAQTRMAVALEQIAHAKEAH